MKAKEYLTQLKGIDALLLTISTELACAEQGIAPSGTRLSLCPSFSGGKSDKTADGGIKLADLRMQLEENREKYICIKTTAARLINKIDDIDHQKVLYKYYLQNMTLTDTAEDMERSYQNICALREKALEEFQKLMDEEGIS